MVRVFLAVLFDDGRIPHKSRGGSPITDHQKLTLALGLLGQLNSKLDMQTCQSSDIYAEIRLIRQYLIAGLGVKVEG